MAISNSDLAASIAALIDRWNTRENQMIALISQETGTVIVTDGLGQNHTLPSFPQLQLEVSQLVADAGGAADVALGHANTALQHRNAAGDFADASSASADDAQEALSQLQDEAAVLTAATTAARDAASASATAAAGSATSASGSASTANTHKIAAASSATSASTSQTNAGTSAATASTQAGIASTAKVAAETARDKAALWASAPVNTVVESGEYSAKHYAAQAQAAVLGSLIYMGTWSAASGAYPVGAQKGHFYKVGAAGTVSGTSFGVGDQIVHNGTDWDKIDNTDAVSTVAGKSGAVTLVSGDIGGLGALATRSDADWTTHITGKPSTFTPSTHNHAATDINSGTFANARIAVGNVTQHQASLSITWSQIASGKPTTLGGYGITDGVDNASAQTVAGIKTFSSSPLLPTPTAGDNTTKGATTAYVVTALGSYVLTSAFTWANLTSKPTSLSGLGITDASLSTYFSSSGALGGFQFFDRTNGSLAFVWYSTGGYAYLYGGASDLLRLSTGGELSLIVSGAEFKRTAANSTTLTRQPRIFVGGSDPGAAAADGDLWIT